MKALLYSFSFALFLTIFPSQLFAQAPCGSIIGSDVLGSNVITIQDCTHPFGVTTIDPPNPYVVVLDGQDVVPDSTIALPQGKAQHISYRGTPANSWVLNTELFKHQGTDYQRVDLGLREQTPEDYVIFAETYFATVEERTRYVEIVTYNFEYTNLDDFFLDSITGEPLIDEVTGETVEARYFAFVDAFEAQFDPSPAALEAGTYRMLFYEASLEVTSQTIWDAVREFLIPTAYAQCQQCLPPQIYTVTFTIVEAPTGASSILFLPGIQASRLYKEGILGFEDQIWEPSSNQDVTQLALTSDGVSINDVYTKDVIDEVVAPIIGGNIYKGFLNYLEDIKQDKIITDYKPFAYDWRFSVNDIVLHGTKYENEVKSIVNEIELLAKDSYTKKVTIVGHSNGGLLAKELTVELERLGKGNLIDEIIFIGTPHLGTPKAIGTVLHGYDQQKVGGVIIDDKDAREVINNMPGAYALLPSEAYLNKSSMPVISFGPGSVTTGMRFRYGTSVNTVTEYADFLNGAEGRGNVYENISIPYVTNQNMLNNALLSHKDTLDNWTPPNGVPVHNIVGVGLKTIAGVEYREVTERLNCTTNIFGQISCPPAERLLRPYAQFTQYGDETVTSLSAESTVGDTYYFDFDEYRNENLVFDNETHADFTEIDEIHTLVNNLITNTTTSVDFITSQKPTFTEEYTVLSIDSPVQVLVTDNQGKRTGVGQQAGENVVLKEIPGSEYIEFGGTKYLIVPKDITATTTLVGEDFGSYTLTTATLKQNGTQEIQTYLSDATTTPQMTAVFTIAQGTSSPLQTDINGDGKVDYKSTLNGQLIVEVQVTFGSLRQEINSLGLSKSREKPLLVLIDLAEQLTNKKQYKKINQQIANEILHVLDRLIIQYEKKRWITKAQSTAVQRTIKQLQNNIK